MEQRRAGEQESISALLRSDRADRLLEEWAGFLETSPHMTSGPNAGRDAEELVAERFEKALARVRKRAGQIERPPSARSVHRLRLAAKKARYLIDLFEPLHPEAVRVPAARSLRRLQSALGDYHDAALQEERVLRFSASLASERGKAPTVLALGRLVGDLGRRQSTILRTLPDLVRALPCSRPATNGSATGA